MRYYKAGISRGRHTIREWGMSTPTYRKKATDESNGKRNNDLLMIREVNVLSILVHHTLESRQGIYNRFIIDTKRDSEMAWTDESAARDGQDQLLL